MATTRLGLLAGLLLALAGGGVQGSAADAGAPLVLEATIPLKDVSGRIDHMAIDLARRRLAVAELGNDTADVIDLNSRAVRRITYLKEPQGVAFTPGGDALVVANGDDGSVRFFRADDLAPTGRVDLRSDADNVRVDKTSGHIVVGYGAGGLAVIDPGGRMMIIDIPLPVHPEGFQLSPDGKRAYVNLPDARQVAVVDLSSGRQQASWPMKDDLRSNFPMAIDTSGATLAIAFRGPPRLVILDAGTGVERTSIGTCGDADDVFFDERRGRVYVSCGEGMVDVLERKDGKMQRIAQVPTASGARTALFVPEMDRLYVAARAGSLGGEAKVFVFRPAQ